ncbi:MAG TPA: YbaB/EbfC family nucleoid-associated protein [Burkholderiales bacterium]|nr:YbaB/EbfC family nucleoid-associated protein [Burkholderiales bacterium]
MKGNIGQMMKQAQMMQENMRRMQEQLGSLEVEGQSGSGMVKLVMNCKHEVRRVSIDPSLTADREMLEDLLVAAFNDGARKVEETVNEKMKAVTAGMGLPAGLKLPF